MVSFVLCFVRALTAFMLVCLVQTPYVTPDFGGIAFLLETFQDEHPIESVSCSDWKALMCFVVARKIALPWSSVWRNVQISCEL